jgi:hypothetical protein
VHALGGAGQALQFRDQDEQAQVGQVEQHWRFLV